MKYRTSVADPPWDHSEGTGPGCNTVGYGRTRRKNPSGNVKQPLPYPVMSVDEIAALPVADLAEGAGAHLYLWTTNRYLRFAWDIAEEWGFSVSSVQVWCKKSLPVQIGGAFQSNVEFFLFARRGVLPTSNTSPTRWFTWPRRRGSPVRVGQRRGDFHSAKPEAFLDLVETISPGPYLELFARRQRLGWDTWGNEALNHVELSA